MLQFEWTSELSDVQMASIKEFYHSLPLVHIEQYPGWNNIERSDIKVRYCIGTEDKKIIGYTAVCEYRKIEARIIFGPLSKDPEDCIHIILEVIRYYKAKDYFSLQVLLGMSVGTEATYLQYSLYKKHSFKWYFDKYNKGTLLLRLDDKSEEELLRHFSENHRRAIKKAIKNNLACRVLQTSEQVADFASGYYKMYKNRGIKLFFPDCIKSFSSIHDWIRKEKSGFFMGVFENEEMKGGMLVIFRGARAEYYRGFSLQDDRKLPINHITFYEAMKLIKKEGIPYFDFGGYNILVDEEDSVFQINQFKKGFHGEYFFYPPVMYFDLKSGGTTLIRFLKNARKKISRLKN